MSTFTEQMQSITIHTDKVITFEPARIWWHNGVKQAKTGGSFYARANDFPAGLIAPWAPEERFDGEAGFTTTMLKVAVLAQRSQAFRKFKDADGKDQIEYMPRWEKGLSIHTELLCLIEGHDEAVVWSMKGLTGAAVTGRGGILQTYRNGILKEAARLARQALPEWAFWLPIATKRSGEKIAYEDTGFGSFVTPPALFLPENPIDTLFVGADILDRGADILNDYPDWETTRRLPKNTIEGEYAPALPAPKNTPIPIDDTDVF